MSDTAKLNDRLASEFFDLDARIETLIWLASTAAHPNEAFREICRDDPEKVVELLALDLVLDPEDDDEELDPAEVLSEAARTGRMGFLVNLATPVFEYDNPNEKDSSALCSWGHFHTEWVYTEALDEEFIKKVEAWRDARHEHDRQKQLQANTPSAPA